jgi:hypothetical protein
VDTPEKIILTRLFAAQRRLRFVRGVAQALRWFAAGTVLASLGLLLLWNWDRLPGPWQWLAAAGRPRELLWLPPLLALGGFASRWLVLPPERETAYQLDRLRQSQERLLTAVDWILSEKPRTAVSERLLGQVAQDLGDERLLRRDLRQLERIPARSYALLGTLALPVTLLMVLPAHLGLPDSAAVWLGTRQVDRLTEALVEEMAANPLENPGQKLKELLQKAEQASSEQETGARRQEQQRELQRAVDQLRQLARGQESARQLLETLAQRARQGQQLSPEDQKALAELKKIMANPEQQQALQKAEQSWQKGQHEQAAQSLEQLQQDAGQSAHQLERMAQQGEHHQPSTLDSGQQFDEQQGDQHGQERKEPSAPGRGQQPGQGQASGGPPLPGAEGEEQAPGDFGTGTTEQEETGPNASGQQRLRQAGRTSEKEEEFRNLHEPVRVELETSQTRIRGARGEDGPLHRTDQEGRGAVTNPAQLESGGGLLQYRQDAENALLREEIPADHRDQVRQYFEALDR